MGRYVEKSVVRMQSLLDGLICREIVDGDMQSLLDGLICRELADGGCRASVPGPAKSARWTDMSRTWPAHLDLSQVLQSLLDGLICREIRRDVGISCDNVDGLGFRV